MPSNSDLDELGRIAAEAEVEPQWIHLSTYYTRRGRGLRQSAFKALALFINQYTKQSFGERLRLCLWIAARRSRLYDERLLIPQPLQRRMLDPTLREWIVAEPASADAHFLFGALALGGASSVIPHQPFAFRRAISLNPSHQEARIALAQWLIAGVQMNQHELPYCYLGSAAEDQLHMREAIRVLQHIQNPATRGSLKSEVEHLLEMAIGWEEFLRSAHTDFAGWCVERGYTRGFDH